MAAARSNSLPSARYMRESGERFVRSIKEECLDRIIPIGERHFRRAVSDFVAHYHRERNPGAGESADRECWTCSRRGRIRRRARLGGLLNYYERAA
jgi:putative transposase